MVINQWCLSIYLWSITAKSITLKKFAQSWEKLGYNYESDSDTKLILKAYYKWGIT